MRDTNFIRWATEEQILFIDFGGLLLAFHLVATYVPLRTCHANGLCLAMAFRGVLMLNV